MSDTQVVAICITFIVVMWMLDNMWVNYCRAKIACKLGKVPEEEEE